MQHGESTQEKTVNQTLLHTGILLVAHGTRVSSCIDDILAHHAQKLQETGRFADVAFGTHQGDANIPDALAALGGDRVLVVPVILSKGYFYKKVIPAYLHSGVGGRDIILLDSIGNTEAMHDVVTSMIATTATNHKLADDGFDILVVAHGGKKSTTAGDQAYAIADVLAARHPSAQVSTCFIEQPPLIEDILKSAQHRPTIALNYFIGSDTGHGHEIVEAIAGYNKNFPHVPLYLSPPIGESAALTDLFLTLIENYEHT